MSAGANGCVAVNHRGHRGHRGGTEEKTMVIRAHGSIVSNDMKLLFFLCATSVSSVSSVVRSTVCASPTTELEQHS